MLSLKHSYVGLIQDEDYQRLLHDITIERSKFAKVQGTISGQSFLQGIVDDLFISLEVHHLFTTKPTFEKYIEVDEAYIRVIKFSCLDEEKWYKFVELTTWDKFFRK